MTSTRYGGAVTETEDKSHQSEDSDEWSKKRPRERIRRRGYDYDDSNVVPVAVTLRNAFAPEGPILKLLQLGAHARELDMSNTSVHRSDESLSLPIQMEIVAPHSLLIELKNTYRSNRRMKKKIAKMFGLGKMEKENSGRDSDIHRLTPICCVSCLDSDSCLSNTLKQSMSGTISHPTWDHMQEQLEDLFSEVIIANEATVSTPSQATSEYENDDETSPWLQKNKDSKRLDLLNQRQEIWNRIKLSMRIQCKAVVNLEANIQSNFQNGIENGATSTSGNKCCHEPEFDMCRPDVTYFILSATSLDANFLKKLPTNLEGKSMSDPSMLGPISKYSQSVPNALPRNSILVHFSDGSSRISPKLFDFLVKEGVLDNDDDNIYENRSGNQDHENDNFSESCGHHIFNTIEDLQVDTFQNRFSDDLQALSSGKWGLQRRDTNRSQTGSFASLFDSLTIKDRGRIETSLAMTLKSSDGRDNKNNQADRENSTEFFDLTSNSLQGIRSRQGSHHGSNEQSANDDMSDSSEKNALEIMNSIKKLDEQIENLSQMLNTEVSYYEEERIKHDQFLQQLHDFISNVNELVDERIEIDIEASGVEDDYKNKEAELESRRRELIYELRERIFPLQSGDSFAINGIPLPKDLHSLSDELISAGLGFVCLAIIMCSKYLSIPLRYRLIFNSSRSAIREDSNVFPLFKERVVERDQFDRGILLLHRNIDHLLQKRGLESNTSDEDHILAKVGLLLNHI